MALIDLHMLTAAARGAVTPGNVPVGTVIAYMGIDVPDQWLPCDGQAVSRTTYAELFAVLGVVHGEGDGVETFNLPNLNNGSFLEGGATAGVPKEAGLPNITGEFDFTGNACGGRVVGAISYYQASGTTGATISYSQAGGQWRMTLDASRSSTVYGASTTVQPKATTVRWLIRAQHGGEGSGMINARDEMHESGVYTAPVTGWYTIVLKGGGGGGASGANSNVGGAGGGEGGTTYVYTHLIAGDQANVMIGAGGQGGQPTASGTQGGTTTVIINDQTATAQGGGGGGYVYGNPAGFGGAGDVQGCPGGPGILEASFCPGGSGGGEGGGISTQIGNGTYCGTGQPGVNGGGGAGGGWQTSRTCYAGGDGGDGYVWFLYHDPRKT